MRMAPVLAARLVAALGVAAALAAAPARAESPTPPEKPLSEQIEEALRGRVERVEPALEQLRDTFRVREQVDSLEHYEKPEILPNGDIIIRRKPDAPPYAPEGAPEEGGEEGGEPDMRT